MNKNVFLSTAETSKQLTIIIITSLKNSALLLRAAFFKLIFILDQAYVLTLAPWSLPRSIGSTLRRFSGKMGKLNLAGQNLGQVFNLGTNISKQKI